MYKVDIENKKLIKLAPARFSSLNLRERYDIEECIEKTPEMLGEDLLIISKELPLPSGRRLDLLAIDKDANLVIIEIKKDDSGTGVGWQAVTYASQCETFLPDEIFKYYAQYLKADEDEAQLKIEEFINEEIDKLNDKQRIILVSKEFHQDVISAVQWLRDYGVDIACMRLELYLDKDNQLFINPDLIVPLHEAMDYIKKKETKEQEERLRPKSSFSLEKSNLPDEELEKKLLDTLERRSDLTPRVIAFMEIVASEDRVFNRDEVKNKLFEKSIGDDIGQTGRYLSNISQFLTKGSNPHLRQVVEFESGGSGGQMKDNYRIIPSYRKLVLSVLEKIKTEKKA
jgi:hypothetical protein